MHNSLDEVCSLDDLRSFIHVKLCEKENLLPDQFTLTEIPLTRCGSDCGLQFTLFGPRSIRLAAIWASDLNTIYFYDTNGIRYSKAQLKHRLTAEPQVA